jgi:hypothetical protein
MISKDIISQTSSIDSAVFVVSIDLNDVREQYQFHRNRLKILWQIDEKAFGKINYWQNRLRKIFQLSV